MWSQGYLAKETKLLLDIRCGMSTFRCPSPMPFVEILLICFVLQFVQCSLLEWQDRFIGLILGQAELQMKTLHLLYTF